MSTDADGPAEQSPNVERQLALMIEALRRGLPVDGDLLERMVGPELATWLLLHTRVRADALSEAATARRCGQLDRVRVIVTVMPKA